MRFPGGSPELYASRVSGLPPGYIYFLQCHVFWAVWAFLLLVELLFGALCGIAPNTKFPGTCIC